VDYWGEGHSSPGIRKWSKYQLLGKFITFYLGLIGEENFEEDEYLIKYSNPLKYSWLGTSYHHIPWQGLARVNTWP